jgi:hypothetical protein
MKRKNRGSVQPRKTTIEEEGGKTEAKTGATRGKPDPGRLHPHVKEKERVWPPPGQSLWSGTADKMLATGRENRRRLDPTEPSSTTQRAQKGGATPGARAGPSNQRKMTICAGPQVDAGSSIESCGGQRAEGLGALPGRGSAPSLRAPLGTHDPAGILPFSLGQISASVLTSGQTPTSFGSPATRDVTTLASCFPHAEPSRPPTS